MYIYYEFDLKGENLYRIRYCLDDSEYLFLREALVNKYGMAEQEDNVGLLTHVGTVYVKNMDVAINDVHWCVKYDSYDVEIDLWRTGFVSVLVYSVYSSAGSNIMNSDI